MKPFNPHEKSQRLRLFKPSRKPAGVFTLSIALCDASLTVLAFFLAVSPFVMQPGINVTLPASPFTGGARFGSMVLSITPGGWFYFDDERLDAARLPAALEAAASADPGAPLIIEADERVEHGTVILAWNAALEAGITEVSMATRISAIEEGLQ
ncbi:ExbD/TolR family protein [Pontiella sp.]|uniref:ExbD/TolR family protein n=1 Tax=Pontiella sp. TaxID=2837462 RepID=UPI0035643381